MNRILQISCGKPPPSPGYFFYVRLSCQWLGPGYVFVNDVPGDNQIGLGTTNTTWNLQ